RTGGLQRRGRHAGRSDVRAAGSRKMLRRRCATGGTSDCSLGPGRHASMHAHGQDQQGALRLPHRSRRRSRTDGVAVVKLVILSGLSGSGKSVALNMLEDLGYYCIDNLPITLIESVAKATILTGE